MPMLVGCVFAGPLIALWVGADAPPIEPALIWLLFAWNTIIFFQQPFGYLLAGVSEVKRTTLYCVLTAITSTALMLLLAHPFGAPGVVLGLLLGYLPFNLVGNILETNRYLRTCLTAPSPA
jgi:O-antigen/teichoic acid export membrane protein